MKILHKLHTYYGFFVFAILFFVFFPLFLVPILFPKQFHLIGIFNRWWAKALFFFVLLPYKVEHRSTLDPKRQYIFCANHFSYLDIPVMGLAPVSAIFVGKYELGKIPLFGFMYNKLHITVNRSKLKSRMNTQLLSMQALDDGKSLIIFPEGGIFSKQPPHIVPFKDGAFRAAVEKQIPVVPVSIPYNWIILPDDKRILHRGLIKVIFHEPIETKGYTLDRVNEVKKKVFEVIDHEMKIQNAHHLSQIVSGGAKVPMYNPG
jgi:1-acyl-sn-glycerol-3-phosphate acyltransferase